MTIEKDTVITLENNEKYVINNITFYGGVKYALATSDNQEKEKIILEEIIENNELYIQKIDDAELINILSKILEG